MRRRSRSFSTTDQAGLAVQERNGQQFGGAARHQFGKAVDDLPARDLRALPRSLSPVRAEAAGVDGQRDFGRSAPGYHYSTAVAGAHITWDDASLDWFLSSTMNVVHGTKMFPAVPAETGNITWPNILR